VSSCHHRTITSQYFGSSSITRASRLVCSHAINVVPDTPNGSRIVSRVLLLFRSARSTNSAGFVVGCCRFAIGRLMNQTLPWFRSPHRKLRPVAPNTFLIHFVVGKCADARVPGR
jgi:hypothetical protein